ncbi:Mobile element protein [Azospirillum largimobile]
MRAVWPYLLRDVTIDRPNQVWCADITYIPMRRDFLYLVAVMDWATRKVLSWRLSNTMDVEFCIEAVEEAMARHGRWIGYYNIDRPHSALGDRTPEEACQGTPEPIRLAA